LESDDAILEGKDRIVTCHFDTGASKKLTAALSQYNLTSFDNLATVQLNAQPFTLGIATVFCRAFGFC
jgi:type 1 fimbria pilin